MTIGERGRKRRERGVTEYEPLIGDRGRDSWVGVSECEVAIGDRGREKGGVAECESAIGDRRREKGGRISLSD